jgi:SepF-like predicted cell division protein (DUF552 family)
MVLDKIKSMFGGSSDDSLDEEYIELDLASRVPVENKVLVKLFVIKKYEDIAKILNAIREGYTIAIVDFKTLRQKDPLELKRAVAKLKKTVEAIDGSIAGHDTFLVVTPSFAKIHKEIEEDSGSVEKVSEKSFE